MFKNAKNKLNGMLVSMAKEANQDKYQKAIVTTTAVASGAVLSIGRVYALTEMVDSFVEFLTSIYDQLVRISTYIYVVVMIFTLVSRLFARSPQAIQMSNTVMKNATIAWVAIRIFGLILNTGRDVFDQTDIEWTD